MCTIITADTTIDKRSLITRLRHDASSNSDGFSMLMILKGGKPLAMTSLDVEAIVSLIEVMDYERVFLHTRYATYGVSALQNCHGWNAGGTYIFHNGAIRSKIAEKFEVDSMAIRYWLENYGLDETLEKLDSEAFANVFLVDIDKGEYIVHRSTVGSLFTDNLGNYSTGSFDGIDIPVPVHTYEIHTVACDNTNEQRWATSYTNWADDYTTQRDTTLETLDDYDQWMKRSAM